MKKCNKCLIEKEINLFPKTGAKCKECVAEYKKKYALLNKDKIKEYRKEYYSENKDDIIESKKVYYENNKEKIISQVKEYTINNIDKIKEYKDEYNKNNPNLEYHKEYREKNKELVSQRKKDYYQNNKEKVKEKVREYTSENREYVNQRKRENREKNKDYLNEKNREYIKKRKENEPLFKLTCSIRTLITQSFKGQFTTKAKKTIEILGCDFETFKEHIETQFTDDMNWDNYASYWQLDHKTPISWSECEEDVYKLNHYTNFQPLFWKDNISKGNRWED
jgi:hypothetical protein